MKKKLSSFMKKIDQVNGHEFVIEENGMPLFGVPSFRGDLIVQVFIEFPTTLTESQKQQISSILPENSYDYE